MATKRKLSATFPNGDVITRTTARNYSSAWRVWSDNPLTRERLASNGFVGTRGFSSTAERASIEAARYVVGMTLNGWADLFAEVAPVVEVAHG